MIFLSFSSAMIINIISPGEQDYNPNEEINFNLSTVNLETSTTDSCFYSLNNESNISMNKFNSTYFYSLNSSILSNYYSLDYYCNESLITNLESSISVDYDGSANNILLSNDSNWETYSESTTGSAIKIQENYTYDSEWLSSDNISIKIKTNGSSGNTLIYVYNYLLSSYEQIAGYSSTNAGNKTFANINKTKFISDGNDLSLRVTIGAMPSDVGKYYESKMTYFNSSSGIFHENSSYFGIKPNITINSPLDINHTTNEIIFNISVDSKDVTDTCLYSLNGANNITLGTIKYSEGNDTGFSFSTADNITQPFGVETNGTFIWVSDPTDNDIKKYHMNGTYSGDSFNSVGDYPFGITQNGTDFWVVDNTLDRIHNHDMDGTYNYYIDMQYSQCTSPFGITNDGDFLWIIDLTNLEVCKFYINGTNTDFHFDTLTDGGNSGISSYGDYLFLSDSGDDEVYKYYYNGTYTGISFDTAVGGNGQPYGITNYQIDNYNSNFLIVDSFGDKVYEYYLEKSTNQFNHTNSSMEQGSHEVTFYCNSTNTGFSSNTGEFFIDSIYPQLSFNYLTTTQGSQTFTFNTTIQDTNLDSCKYSIYNSTGSIDGANENISFICNQEKSATTTSYGNFVLKIYAIDSANNENSTNMTFLLNESEAGVGGGSFSTITNYEPSKNISIVSENLNNILDISLAKDSIRPRSKTFLIINKGIKEEELNLACEEDNSTNSTTNINICDYVVFPNETLIISPNEQNPERVRIEIYTPENSTIGDEYFFNIIGTTQEKNTIKFSKLSVSTKATFLGQIRKWSLIPALNDTPIEDRKAYPVWAISMILSFISFVTLLTVLSKKDMPVTGFFLGVIVSFVVFFTGVAIF